MDRKLLPILLCLSLFAPALLTYSWLQLERYEVKREIKRKIAIGLPENQLIRFTFSKEQSGELEWEHDEEFEYKGEMYDVVRSEDNGDSITYWCWWDHAETELNQMLAGLVSRAMSNHPEKDQKEKSLISYFKTYYRAEVFEWSLTKEFTHESAPVCSLHCFYQYRLGPATPPPRFC